MNLRIAPALLLCLGALLCPPAALGQDSSKILDKLVRDQQMVRMRLQRIEEMMGRLERKLEEEGGSRNAFLIRRAREELERRDIYNRIEEIEALINERRLQVVEKQEVMTHDLEDIFAILQDRTDMERLQDLLGNLAEGLAKTGELLSEQEQLLKETRELVHTPKELLDRVLKNARDVLGRQQALNRTTSDAAQAASTASSYLQVAAELDALAARQEDLALKTADSIAARSGEAAGILGRASRDQDSLAARLEKLAAEPGGATGRDAAESLRRQIALAEEARRAEEELAAAEETSAASEDGGAGAADARRALEAAQAAMDRARSALEEARSGAAGGDELAAKLAEAAAAAREAAERMRSAEEEAGKGGDGSLAPEQEEIGAELERVREKGKALSESEGSSALDEAQKAMESAQAASRAAAEELSRGSDAAGRRSQEEAAAGMRSASEQMRRAWEADAARRQDAAGRMADDQSALARETAAIGEQLDAAEQVLGQEREPEGGEPTGAESGERAGGNAGGASGALAREKDLAEKAAAEMTEAGRDLRRDDPGGAEEPQARAAEGIESLIAALEGRAREASEAERTEGGGMTAEERSEDFQELGRRQKELEERARDLMDRLRELPDNKPASSLATAADNMESAARELSSEQGEMAERDEEDARKALEQTLQDLLQERQKYQNIRQREVLFRVQQELESIKEEQDKINAETAAFEGERDPGGTLRRSQKRQLLDLAGRETGVSSRVLDIRNKIEEDGSSVFTWVLDRNRDDLEDITDSLKRYRTDKLVQAVQTDVSRRFADLIAALKQELERRRDAPRERSQPQQNQARQPLIPPVAELIMVKTMEEGALRRLEEFQVMNPDLSATNDDPLIRTLIKRIANEHIAVTELFEEILGRAAESGAPVGDPNK